MSPETDPPRNSSAALRLARRVTLGTVFISIALAVNPGCHVAAPSIDKSQGKVADFASQFATATGIKLVQIPAGTFAMGSPADEVGRQPNEGPQTKVTLTKDFFLGATAVTQGQWTAVMGSNPSHFKGDTLPVETVSWDEATAFCQKLTERERAAGRLGMGYAFSLPTEAQWEYACRAGTTGPYAGDLDAMAWYSKNSGSTTHPVGTKKPNAWGLFDMHGNVFEWCADWYAPYSGGVLTDPAGPVSGSARVYRGGRWGTVGAICRSAHRDFRGPGFRVNFIGFRVALGSVR